MTWDNQPATTNVQNIEIPKSGSTTQDYTDIDLLDLVRSWHNQDIPNFGILLKLTDESPYKSLVLASSDHQDKSLHPKLVIKYEN